MTVRLLALLLPLWLAACGFHLQGAESWPDGWPHFALSYPPRDAAAQEFGALLDESLRRRGVTPGKADAININVQQLRDRKVVAAIGVDGKAAEYELQRIVKFQFTAGERRFPVIELTASRRMSFEPSLVLAKTLEEQELRHYLSRELVELMLLRIEAELRSLPAGA